MARRLLLGATAVAAAVFSAISPAAACAPPCGPIPAFLTLTVDPSKDLLFANATQMTLPGTISYYVNIDQDGYYYDPQNRPVISFHVNRAPPWVKASFEPTAYTVPVDDSAYVGPENGDATQIQYYWEAPVNVTVLKLRDPTPDELGRESPWIHRDGTYRVTLSASSTGSLLAPDVLGGSNGLQEGYGARELYVVPEIEGVAWRLSAEGVLAPVGGPASGERGGSAPGPEAFLVALTLVLVIGAARRRP